MALQIYTTEFYDARSRRVAEVTIKQSNEADGLSEAVKIGRGRACAFFQVRAARGLIFDSRDS